MLSARLFLTLRAERGADRENLEAAGTMRDAAPSPVTVAVRDLSVSGVRFHCDIELTIGQRVRIGMSGLGIQAATVVHSNGGYGCVFDRALSAEAVRRAQSADTIVPFDKDAAAAASGEPEAVRYSRQVRVGILIVGVLLSWWMLLKVLS